MSTSTTTNKRIEVRHDLKPPGKFQVIFMNDNVTAMDFVIMVLHEIFGHDHETAIDIMMKIHNDGSAIVALLIVVLHSFSRRGMTRLMSIFPKSSDASLGSSLGRLSIDITSTLSD